MAGTEPSGYNRSQSEPSRVWTECQCGWKTRKRKPGKPPALVAFKEFYCPRCGTKLSENTVVRLGR